MWHVLPALFFSTAFPKGPAQRSQERGHGGSQSVANRPVWPRAGASAAVKAGVVGNIRNMYPKAGGTLAGKKTGQQTLGFSWL